MFDEGKAGAFEKGEFGGFGSLFIQFTETIRLTGREGRNSPMVGDSAYGSSLALSTAFPMRWISVLLRLQQLLMFYAC